MPWSPDWKVCIIAQPKSRLRNFGPSARPGAQILKIYFSGAQFEKVRMQNAIAQFLKRVERAEMEAQNTQHAVKKGETAPWAKRMGPDTRNERLVCCYGWFRSSKFARLTNS